MQRAAITAATGIMLLLSGCQPSVTASGWQLVWQDEFDSAGLDLEKWSFEETCWGGGNNELQCYTARPENAFIADGMLHIVAKQESYSGPAQPQDDPAFDASQLKTLPFTSARLRTKGKGDWRYGRFEIRAKLPWGQGSWPAIWMLPTDWHYGPWPLSGEIDIMEAVNLRTRSDSDNAAPDTPETRIHGTLHYGNPWPDNTYTGQAYKLPDGQDPSAGFHVYAVEWEQDEIRWYVDNVHYATQQHSGWFSGNPATHDNPYAPFDQRFHLLINLAVGGDWAANVNEKGVDNSIFPQQLLIDYVRVYQCTANPETGAGCARGG